MSTLLSCVCDSILAKLCEGGCLKINEIHEKKEEYIKAITQLGRNISKSDHYNKNHKY